MCEYFPQLGACGRLFSFVPTPLISLKPVNCSFSKASGSKCKWNPFAWRSPAAPGIRVSHLRASHSTNSNSLHTPIGMASVLFGCLAGLPIVVSRRSSAKRTSKMAASTRVSISTVYHSPGSSSQRLSCERSFTYWFRLRPAGCVPVEHYRLLVQTGRALYGLRARRYVRW